jgi:protocatechuate 3,4-dioxygenase beta subunit
MKLTNRRDLLFTLGATISLGPFALSRIARHHGEILGSDAAGPGTLVAGLDSVPLRCTAGTLSQEQMEGPFYTPKTPHRRDIRDLVASGEALVLGGRVLDSQCRPVAGAVLDFWQTGHDGIYDQHGYRYRGHQYTDSAGRFELVTVRPRAYTALRSWRTPHIHVKVQGPGTRLLTTQLYLPDEKEANGRDGLFDPSLAIAFTRRDGAAEHAVFDFVLAEA